MKHVHLETTDKQLVVVGGGLKRVTVGDEELLRGVTHKLSFQVTGSVTSVQDYGATVCSGP